MLSKPIDESGSSETVFVMPCTKRRSYPVISVPNVFDSALLAALLGDRQALLVTTPTVYALHGAPIRAFCSSRIRSIETMVLFVREESKTYSSVERVCRRALELSLDRRSILIALGGGVCSDVTSLAASLVRRGIDCIRIPTTLVGQVDAGLGVKTAVNFDGKKSYLGSFYPPMAVLLDPTFLRTLPLRHFHLGLAEMIKMGLVCDAELFASIEAEWPRFAATSFDEPHRDLCRIIWLSARRMLEELNDNLFEDVHKRLLDAGHTFSPQIEAASGFTVHHGEAVAIDLSFSATIAAVAGVLTWTDRERVIRLVQRIGLPIYTPLLNEELCERALVEARRHRGGESNVVLPVRIGSGTFVDIRRDLSPRILATALETLRRDGQAVSVAELHHHCSETAPVHIMAAHADFQP
jgi:3-dehydroquinate synthase